MNNLILKGLEDATFANLEVVTSLALSFEQASISAVKADSGENNGVIVFVHLGVSLEFSRNIQLAGAGLAVHLSTQPTMSGRPFALILGEEGLAAKTIVVSES